MPELKNHRLKFTQGIAKLIFFIYDQGHSCLIGPDGLPHMKNSLHYDGLACDLTIYKDGKYLDKTEDYKFAGDYWKSLDPDFRWGGDFKQPDGNHFSCTYQGKA